MPTINLLHKTLNKVNKDSYLKLYEKNWSLYNILSEEKDFEGALKLLNAPHDSGFDGLFADLKGDVLVSLGKNAEAKEAYQQALTKLEPQGKFRVLTQQKLESLG